MTALKTILFVEPSRRATFRMAVIQNKPPVKSLVVELKLQVEDRVPPPPPSSKFSVPEPVSIPVVVKLLFLLTKSEPPETRP